MIRKILFTLIVASFTNSAQIKDLASVVGVRDNQLIGYGLVVGLNGTGDGSSSEFTIQSLSNMLQTVNVKIDPKDIKSKNTAAVMVTAKLPAFARQGDKIDIVVSSIGDAKSLHGGTLLLTALKGVDGDIYALAQGPLTLGGGASKGGGHPTVGTILGGALIEREVTFDFYDQENVNLSLNNSSFQTAISMQNAINAKFGKVAVAIDPRTIKLSKPPKFGMVEFVAGVLDIQMGYKPDNKVVIDERTGTVVSGINITVDPVVISHGNITIKIDPNLYDPQNLAPNDVAIGNDMAIDTSSNSLKIASAQTTVANITRALNRLGASPRDIIAIIENLKRVGAIHAQVEVI